MTIIKNPMTIRLGKAQPISGVKIDDYSGSTLEISSPVEVTASFIPEDSTIVADDYQYEGIISWTSSNPSVIDVTTTEENGVYTTKVVPVGTSGSTTITVNARDYSDSFNVEIEAPFGTLSGLKSALNKGIAETDYPIGTEIPDTYTGNDNPLIVGIYENIDGKTRVGLVRKYIEPISQVFGSSVDYPSSDIFAFLNSVYFENCSDELKPLVSETELPYYNGTTSINVSGKWHLLSVTNVLGVEQATEGNAWAYWKNVTGLSSASNSGNTGRIRYGRDGASQIWWLRSQYSKDRAYYIATSGGVGATNGQPGSAYGVLPICYIIQD